MLTLHSCVPAFINAVHCSMDSVISWRKLYLQLFHPKILKFRKNLIVKQVLEASTKMCFLKIDVPKLEIDGGTFNSNFTNKWTPSELLFKNFGIFLGASTSRKTFGHFQNCKLTVGILVFSNCAKLQSVSLMKWLFGHRT